MIVQVTQDDIDKGVRKACAACPVALAINHVLQEGLFTATGGCLTKIYKNTQLQVTIENTVDHREFIMRFDAGAEMVPTRLLVDIPEELLC